MEKSKLVLHIARTSLAGAPIRIVDALNKYTEYEARLAVYLPIRLPDERLMYKEDISWENPNQRIEVVELAKRADVIHMHHFMNTDITNPFLLDFDYLKKPTCKILRHFDSDRDFLSKTEIRYEETYKNDKLPKVVIPHYPERTFPDLDIVPNIIPINDELYKPVETNNEKLKVVYSASNRTSYKDARWATKGYPEVSPLLKNLSEKYNFEYIEINNMTFKEAMSIKQQADIVIGDVVTGSYHLTELEALAQGKPSITYLDGRSIMTFMNTFKSPDIPFVNANIDNLEYAIKDLIENKDLRKQIGIFSREWIEKYYDDSKLVKKFVQIYDDILLDKSIIRKNSENNITAKNYLYNQVYDYNWLRNKTK